MGSCLDQLIDNLLNRVALRGHQGAQVKDIAPWCRDFYSSQQDFFQAKPSSLSQLARPTPVVDHEFTEKVWGWLLEREDLSVHGPEDGRLEPHQTATIDAAPESVALQQSGTVHNDAAVRSSVDRSRTSTHTPRRKDAHLQAQNGPDHHSANDSPASAGQKRESKAQQSTRTAALSARALKSVIFADEERVWHSICGHSVDAKKIPPMSFQLLSIISSAGESGIVQPDLVALSGQDKRSVPKRTDILHDQGYIVKDRVIAQGARTSHCRLWKFARTNDLLQPHTEALEKPPEQNPTAPQVVVSLEPFIDLMIKHTKEAGSLSIAALKTRMKVFGHKRKSRILVGLLEDLENFGLVRTESAKIAQVEKRSSHHGIVHFLREPIQTERSNLITGRNLNRDLLGLRTDQEAETPVNNELKDSTAKSHTVYPPASQEQILGHEPGNHWDPHHSITNALFDVIERAGPQGISTMQKELTQTMKMSFYRRPLDVILGRMTDAWQESQPSHLRHLSIIRDADLHQRASHYVYRSIGNFEEAHRQGQTSWEAIGIEKNHSKANASRTASEQDLDKWGFPKISDGHLVNGTGCASLKQCVQAAPFIGAHDVTPKRTKARANLTGSPGMRRGFPTPRRLPFTEAHDNLVIGKKRKRADTPHKSQVHQSSDFSTAKDPSTTVNKKTSKYESVPRKITKNSRQWQDFKDRAWAVARRAMSLETLGSSQTNIRQNSAGSEATQWHRHKENEDDKSQFDISDNVSIVPGLDSRLIKLHNSLLNMEVPGFYLNPPQRMLSKKGRPPRQMYAVIKSDQLQSFDWFENIDEDNASNSPLTKNKRKANPIQESRGTLKRQREIPRRLSLQDGHLPPTQDNSVKKNERVALSGHASAKKAFSEENEKHNVGQGTHDPQRASQGLTKNGGDSGTESDSNLSYNTASITPDLPTSADDRSAHTVDNDTNQRQFVSPKALTQRNHFKKQMPRDGKAQQEIGSRHLSSVKTKSSLQDTQPVQNDITETSARNEIDRPLNASESRAMVDITETLHERRKGFSSEAQMYDDATKTISQPLRHTDRKKGKPRVRKQFKVGLKRHSGSLAHRRQQTIMDIIQQAGGVFPGDREILGPFRTAWAKFDNKTLIDAQTIIRAIKSMVQKGAIKKLFFAARIPQGITTTKSILCLPEFTPTSQKVKNLETKMIASGRNLYIPEGIEVAPDFKRLGSGNTNLSASRQNSFMPLKSRINTPNTLREDSGEPAWKKWAAENIESSFALHDNQEEHRTSRWSSAEDVSDEDDSDDESVSTDLEQATMQFHFELKNYTFQPEMIRRFPNTAPVEHGPQPIDPVLEPKPPYPARTLPKERRPFVAAHAWVARIDVGAPAWKGRLRKDGLYPTLTSPKQSFQQRTGTFSTDFCVLGKPRPLLSIQPPLSKEFEQQMPQNVEDMLARQFDQRRQTRVHTQGNPLGEIEEVARWEKENQDLFTSEKQLAQPRFFNVSMSAPTRFADASARKRKGNDIYFLEENPRKRARMHESFEQQSSRLEPERMRSGNDQEQSITPPETALAGHYRKQKTPITRSSKNRRRTRHHRPSPPIEDSYVEDSLPVSRLKFPEITEGEIWRLFVILVAESVLLSRQHHRANHDWSLIAKLFGKKDFDAYHLRTRWSNLKKRYAAGYQQMEREFEDLYLAAYERNEICRINYEDIKSFDWQSTITYMLEHLKSAIEPDTTNLPSSATNLRIDPEPALYYEPSKSKQFNPRTIPSIAESVLADTTFTVPDNPSLKKKQTHFCPNKIAKSHVRANFLTPTQDLDPPAAREVISHFLEADLEASIKDFESAKVLRPTYKPGRVGPGRNWKLTALHDAAFSDQAIRDAPRVFNDALEYTRDLDTAFAPSDTSSADVGVDRYTEAPWHKPTPSHMLALLNLAAHRRVDLTPHIPAISTEMHGTPSCPPDALSMWGLVRAQDGWMYNSRLVDKERISWPVHIRPTSSYHARPTGLQGEWLGVPSADEVKGLIEGGAVPYFCTVHGEVSPLLWRKMVFPVLSVVALNPGTTADVVAKRLGKASAVEAWEVELMLEILEGRGVAGRVGGLNGSPAGHGGGEGTARGWMVKEGWWGILAGAVEHETGEAQDRDDDVGDAAASPAWEDGRGVAGEAADEALDV